MNHRKTTRALKKKRARLVERFPGSERLLRGSLIERFKKCGKPGCHCVNGQGHGPAYYLSVTVGTGKTRSYYVPVRLRRVVAKHLRNYKELRQLAEQLIEINLELLGRGELELEE